MSKSILTLCMTFMLAACNLTAQPAPTIMPESMTPLPPEQATDPPDPATLPPIQPTMTQVIQPLPTSSFNTINIGTATPLPIGVRAPTQDEGLSGQLTALPPNDQTPTAIAPAQDIPFPVEFNDHYEVSATQGRTIYVTYEAVVNNPGIGRVFIEVRDPAGAVIEQLVVTETTTDDLEVLTETSGTYLVLATSQSLRGFYSVSYGTR